jgi:hypothetical protein
MKKFFAVPLAVLFVAACSESTSPTSTADLATRNAKPTPPPSVTPASGNLARSTYTFDIGAVDAASGTGIGSDTDDATIASNAADVNYAPADTDNGFIGRYNNTHTRTLLVFQEAGSKYTVNFDLYVIGSWDGKGKQAQSGAFQANVFQVAYRCGTDATLIPVFSTTFSNQLTVQQDYPLAYGLGGNKAGSGAVKGSIDALGYKDRPDLSNTPQFRSFGDATYAMSYTLSGICGGTNGTAPTFVLSSTAPGQQSNYDESWGVDNIVLKSDN